MNDTQNGHVETNKYQSEIDFFYLIGVFYRYRKIIIGFTFIVGLVSIIYVLLATPFYQSKMTLYPVNKDQGGPLKELAITLGMSNKTEGYYIHEVISSRRISKKVIYKKYLGDTFKDSMNLIQFFGFSDLEVSENRKFEATLKALTGSVESNEDKETSLITMTIITKDKKLSRDIAKYYCSAITDYLRNELKTQVQQAKLFTKGRLIEVKAELLESENALLAFEQANSKIISPLLSMNYKRLFKKVELLQDVVLLLEKQSELLKIEEHKKTPIINVLDEPDIHDKPVKPQKRQIVVVNTFVAFLLIYILAILKEKAVKYDIVTTIKKELKKT